MEPIEAHTSRSWIAPAAMALGAVVAAVGALLTWTSVSLQPARGRLGARAGGRSGFGFPPGRGGGGRVRPDRVQFHLRATGLDTPGGRLLFGLAIALVVMAGLAWLATTYWTRVAAFAVGLTLGLIGLVLAAVDLASPPSIRGVGAALSGSAGPGVYLALAGSTVAVAAAAAWFVANRATWAIRPVAPPAPPTGPPAPPATPPAPPVEPLPAAG